MVHCIFFHHCHHMWLLLLCNIFLRNTYMCYYLREHYRVNLIFPFPNTYMYVLYFYFPFHIQNKLLFMWVKCGKNINNTIRYCLMCTTCLFYHILTFCSNVSLSVYKIKHKLKTICLIFSANMQRLKKYNSCTVAVR